MKPMTPLKGAVGAKAPPLPIAKLMAGMRNLGAQAAKKPLVAVKTSPALAKGSVPGKPSAKPKMNGF